LLGFRSLQEWNRSSGSLHISSQGFKLFFFSCATHCSTRGCRAPCHQANGVTRSAHAPVNHVGRVQVLEATQDLVQEVCVVIVRQLLRGGQGRVWAEVAKIVEWSVMPHQ